MHYVYSLPGWRADRAQWLTVGTLDRYQNGQMPAEIVNG